LGWEGEKGEREGEMGIERFGVLGVVGLVCFLFLVFWTWDRNMSYEEQKRKGPANIQPLAFVAVVGV
jgi:hypothetical protein